MDFWDHLEELRKVILKSIAVIAIGFVICISFYEQLFTIVKLPLDSQLPKAQSLHHTVQNLGPTPQKVRIAQGVEIEVMPNESIDWDEESSTQLTLLSPTEGLSTTLKLSIWVSLVATSPIWLYFFLNFAAPGLSRKELKWIVPFLFLSLTLIGLGVLFAFYITLPLANHFLFQFNAKLAYNLWSLTNYVNYTLILLLGNALAFESLAVLFLLIHKGVIQAETLKKKRKLAFVLSFVVGAILTPPDIVTQCLLALPLFGFYELSYLYAKLKARK